MSHTTCCHIFLINDERTGTVSVMTNQNAGKYSSCRNLFIEVIDVTYELFFYIRLGTIFSLHNLDVTVTFQKLVLMLLNLIQIRKESKKPNYIHSTGNFQTDKTFLFILTTFVSTLIT